MKALCVLFCTLPLIAATKIEKWDCKTKYVDDKGVLHYVCKFTLSSPVAEEMAITTKDTQIAVPRNLTTFGVNVLKPLKKPKLVPTSKLKI